MNIRSRKSNECKILFIIIALFTLLTVSQVKGNPIADFDGDGKSDIAVFRPSNGFWYVAKSSGGFSFVKWGLADDSLVPGDYDGDGKTDLAVFRRTFTANAQRSNTWYILQSSDNNYRGVTWLPNSEYYYFDYPLAADYDGDGKTDLAVNRQSDAIGDAATFIGLKSSDGTIVNRQFGYSGWDRSVPADYDGDGKTDLAVFRGSVFNTTVNTWFILQTSDETLKTVNFGLSSSDSLVPADYDGDGKADIAVFRRSSGYWYRLNSRDNSFSATQFGLSDDKPVPADYDGDGKTDLAVFRPSNATWYLLRSTAGFAAQQFGLSDDIPIQNTFVR